MAEYVSFKGSGPRVKQLREQLGLTRKEMARRLGLSFPGYCKNESGDSFPGTGTLALLEKEHDISMDWLRFGKGAMHYNKERQRVEALEKELADLKREREQELEKKLALEKEMAGKLVVDDKPGLKELFEYMDRVPLLYHEIMVYFQKFKSASHETENSTPAENTNPV